MTILRKVYLAAAVKIAERVGNVNFAPVPDEHFYGININLQAQVTNHCEDLWDSPSAASSTALRYSSAGSTCRRSGWSRSFPELAEEHGAAMARGQLGIIRMNSSTTPTANMRFSASARIRAAWRGRL